MGSYVRRCGQGMRFRVITSHLNMIRSMERFPRLWRSVYHGKTNTKVKDDFYKRDQRIMSNFEYIGPKYPRSAPKLWDGAKTKKKRSLRLSVTLRI